MESFTAELCEAISGLNLPSVPENFDEILTSNDRTDERYEDSSVHVDEEDNKSSIEEYVRVRIAVNSWINEFQRLSVGTVESIEESALQSNLWSEIAAVAPLAQKAIMFMVNKELLKFFSVSFQQLLPSNPYCIQAAVSIQMYLSLLSLPGALAYGMFNSSLLRKSLSASKRLLEVAYGTEEETHVSERGKKSHQNVPTVTNSDVNAASAESSRRNPRRTKTAVSSSTYDAVAATQDDDAGSVDIPMELGDQGDDDDLFDEATTVRSKRSRKAAAPKQKKASKQQDAHVMLSGEFATSLYDLLLCLSRFLSVFQLRSHMAEFIPAATDVVLASLLLPQHAMKIFNSSIQQSSILVAACAGVLALLHPRHGTPLTTARVVLKKLKPFLLQGAPGSGAVGASVRGVEVSIRGSNDEAMGGQQDDGEDASPQRKIVLPEARVIRGRALYIACSIISDDLSGKVVSLVGVDAPYVHALPQTALSRMPAVEALLQHLVAGAAASKAEVRSHVCEVIVQIRAGLPHSLRRAFLRFLTKFGRSNKISNRMFAIEVSSAILGTPISSSASGIIDAEAFIGGDSVLSAHRLIPSSQIIDSITAEMPIPSAAEAVLESEGYGQEAIDYIQGNAASTSAAPPVSSSSLSLLLSPTAAELRPKSSRPSISTLGAERDFSSPSAAGQRSKPSGTAKSPFYGKKSAVDENLVIMGRSEVGCIDPRPSVTLLLDFLLRRVSDKSSSVRARALISLSALLDPKVSVSYLYSVLLSHICHSESAALKETSASSSSIVLSVQYEDANPLIPLLLRRLQEDKAVVKKAAVSALQNLALSGSKVGAFCKCLIGEHESPDSSDLPYEVATDAHSGVFEFAKKTMREKVKTGSSSPVSILGLYGLQMIATKATDPSVLVRKTVMAAIATLYRSCPSEPVLQSLWLAAVLPLVMDAEASLVAKAVEACYVDIFVAITEWKHDPSSESSAANAVWALLASVSSNPELVSCVRKAVTLLARTTVNSETAGEGKSTGEANVSSSITFRPEQVLHSLLSAVRISNESLAEIKSGSTFVPGITPTAYRRGSWMLVQIISQQFSAGVAKSTKTPILSALVRAMPEIISSWSLMIQALVMGEKGAPSPPLGGFTAIAEDAGNILRVLSMMSSHVPANHASELSSTLISKLSAFAWEPTLASCAIGAVTSLHPGTNFSWTVPIVASCEKALVKFTCSDSVKKANYLSEAACRVLFTIGEMSMIGVTDVIPNANPSQSQQGLVPLPSRLINLVLSLVSTTLVPAISESTNAAKKQPTNVPVPSNVRAHAFLTLGKLCLRDPIMAKSSIALFVQELSPKSPSSTPSIRVNALVVLGDLTVRYTSLVDRHIPAIAATMGDPSPLVRRTAIVLLTQLILEDYVKVRGGIFIRLATCLADSNSTVRDAAEASLATALSGKSKHILQAHFIETVFVLTSSTGHSAYAQLVAAAGGNDPSTNGLTMVSPSARSKVYTTLINAMSDESRIAVAAKIASDILGGVLDGTLLLSSPSELASYASSLSAHAAESDDSSKPTSPQLQFPLGSTEYLISEAFSILSSQEMRTATSGGKMKASTSAAGDADEDAGDDEGELDPGSSQKAAASQMLELMRSKLRAKISKQALFEGILPILLALRTVLLQARSPLNGVLLQYLRILYQDHSTDLRDALAGYDRTLVSELEFDMRAAEEAERNAKKSLEQSSSSTAASQDVEMGNVAPSMSTPMKIAQAPQIPPVESTSSLPSVQKLGPLNSPAPKIKTVPLDDASGLQKSNTNQSSFLSLGGQKGGNKAVDSNLVVQVQAGEDLIPKPAAASKTTRRRAKKIGDVDVGSPYKPSKALDNETLDRGDSEYDDDDSEEIEAPAKKKKAVAKKRK
jgi:non-SMC mitotic condensation complex subunit 1